MPPCTAARLPSGSLRSEGYQVESIAIIESMDWQTQTIKFRPQPVKELTNTNLKPQ